MKPTTEFQIDVLVIDDDELVCRSVQTSLRLLGLKSSQAQTAEDGLRQIKESVPGLVIVDFMLKCSVNGAELTHEIRALNKELPIILITGYHDQSIQQAIESVQRTEFLQKPFSLQELSETISRMTGREIKVPAPRNPR